MFPDHPGYFVPGIIDPGEMVDQFARDLLNGYALLPGMTTRTTGYQAEAAKP